ncbi:MAG: radical SAM protein [Solobacterium sp.]|nr:radical SAM protein [Solobacterium sp.]
MKRAYIEITNVCNLNCSFCRKNHRKPKFMSPDAFRYVLSQVRDYTDYIYLHVQGEPLLHPDFDEIMTVCDEMNVHVQLVTNGTYLKDHMNLLQHGSLRKISFSLQSADYQKDIILSDYLDTILRFCETASRNLHPVCELRFWRSDELSDKAKYCLDRLNRRYAFNATNRYGRNYRIMPNVYVDFDRSFQWPDEEDDILGDSGTCHGAVDQIAVLSNGAVVPCCLDAEGCITFGNIMVTPLNQILSSGRYVMMTEAFRKHKIREDFCRRCTFRLRFK